MKAKNCVGCEYCSRKVWTTYHVPNGYHPIGMSHAYAYCKKYGMRVSEVRKCEEDKK